MTNPYKQRSTSEFSPQLENPLLLPGADKQTESFEVEPLPYTPSLQDLHPVQPNSKYARLSFPRLQRFERRSFIALLLLLCIPLLGFYLYREGRVLYNDVRDTSGELLNKFEVAATQLIGNEYTEANSSLTSASVTILELENAFSFVGARQEIAEVGAEGIVLAQESLQLLTKLKDLPLAYARFNQNPQPEQGELLSADIESALDQAQDLNRRAEVLLKRVRRSEFLLNLSGEKEIAGRLTQVASALTDVEQALTAAEKLLGVKTPHRYVILLQNNYEVRPGGGFIGSFLLVDLNDGLLEKIEPVDIYAVNGQLPTIEPSAAETAPINPVKNIQDSNTSPAFPNNARVFLELLEEANGPSADTVIAVNASFIADLLPVIGELNLPGGVTISQANFHYTFTYLIEMAAKGGSNDPKTVLFGVIDRAKSQIITALATNPDLLLPTIKAGIAQKQIQAYSKDDQLQDLFERFGVSNSLEPSDAFDEILITHTSIGGNKSDAYLDTRYIHDTEIQNDGTIVNHLTIRTYHGFTGSTRLAVYADLQKKFNLPSVPDWLRAVLGDAPNLTRFKVYVPSDSKLLASNGVDLTEVAIKPAHDLEDRELFTFVLSTDPGGVAEATVSYELPNELDFAPLGLYQLQVYRASGIRNAVFEKRYSPVSGKAIIQTTPYIPQLEQEDVYRVEQPLMTDGFFQAIVR